MVVAGRMLRIRGSDDAVLYFLSFFYYFFYVMPGLCIAIDVVAI